MIELQRNLWQLEGGGLVAAVVAAAATTARGAIAQREPALP